jgi:hypothetical protein
MLGNNESARVSASRVLMDALAEPLADGCPRCANLDTEMKHVRERLDRLILDRLERVKMARSKVAEKELGALEPVIAFIAEQYAASGASVPFDVTPSGPRRCSASWRSSAYSREVGSRNVPSSSPTSGWRPSAKSMAFRFEL